ncbi:MAG: Gfo/Idh/MocA family oxidoreductase [Holophagales bacterium]|nr:Gfo/Idh/MocA family oxidoreductase [Holophagales bacterium]
MSKRIALVGCGAWGRHVLRDLKQLGCHVTVLARSEATAERATGGGADRLVRRFEDLPEVDGAVVVTPTSNHGATIEPLLERRIPIFVEKPLSCRLDEASRLVEAAPDRLFIMDKWRYHPGVEALAEIARDGELGEVVGLRTTRLGWGNPHDDVDAIWVLAPHDLSIALEILDHIPEPRTAVADRTPHGASGLSALLGERPWLLLDVGVRSVERRREVHVMGTRGVAYLGGGYADHIEVRLEPESGAEPLRRPISTELPLLRELRAFVDHLGGGPPPRSSAREGLAVVETVARLRELAGLPAGSY